MTLRLTPLITPLLLTACLLGGCQGTGPDLVDSDSGDAGDTGGTTSGDSNGTTTGGSGSGSLPAIGGGQGEHWYRPPAGVTWQWQLLGEVNTGYPVELYDIDLFDTPLAEIQSLQAAAIRVICYFSAGSYEAWRDDAAAFTTADLGSTLDGWPDERWLDIRSTRVHDILRVRLDLARDKGCDGVEPDNVDGYQNDSGFPLSAADQLAFNRLLATEAHLRGLSVGLKNDLDQVAALVGDFDFAVNEQCFEYDECDALVPFIDAGKPVLNAEYRQALADSVSEREALCTDSLDRQFSTLVLPLDLDDAFRYSCR